MVNYISVALMVQKWHKNCHKWHKNDHTMEARVTGMENYIRK
jgi:hypothetical protein